MNDDGGIEHVHPCPPADAGHATHSFDLAAHEQRRLAAVLAASPDLDVLAVLESEAQAHRMLYSGLDAEQQATYRLLVEAGVLAAGLDDGGALDA